MGVVGCKQNGVGWGSGQGDGMVGGKSRKEKIENRDSNCAGILSLSLLLSPKLVGIHLRRPIGEVEAYPYLEKVLPSLLWDVGVCLVGVAAAALGELRLDS